MKGFFKETHLKDQERRFNDQIIMEFEYYLPLFAKSTTFPSNSDVDQDA